jgi:enoyl-CoA hydratase/carnithine racemase
MTESVLFEVKPCVNNKLVAFATLNTPKTLNALNLTMVKMLLKQLALWRDDPQVALVVLSGAGEKGFCAGGDIKHLYQQLADSPGQYTQDIADFFTYEYQLDYLIHTFKKPILVLGSGIVMGGGMGLFMGASHRVVDETTKLAMPEVNIGLFPDVGASWFLSRLPEKVGIFLGITGATLNAGDAKHLAMAQSFIIKEKHQQVIEQLLTLGWGDTVALNHEKLSSYLTEIERVCKVKLPQSDIRSHQELLNELVNPDDIFATVEHVLQTESESLWYQQAKNNLAYGSPLTVALVFKQLALGKSLSLHQCFKMELTLALKSAQFGEFLEGTRALLIDKDKQPNWKYHSIRDVEPSRLDWFFESLWPEHEHPLAAIAS